MLAVFESQGRRIDRVRGRWDAPPPTARQMTRTQPIRLALEVRIAEESLAPRVRKEFSSAAAGAASADWLHLAWHHHRNSRPFARLRCSQRSPVEIRIASAGSTKALIVKSERPRGSTGDRIPARTANSNDSRQDRGPPLLGSELGVAQAPWSSCMLSAGSTDSSIAWMTCGSMRHMPG